MAITQVELASPAGLFAYTDTAMGNLADAIKASSARVYSVLVDNSANVAATYVKLFNLAGGSVVVGTTAPDEVIYVPAGLIIPVFYFTGAAPGKVFASALSAFAVTTGGTAGSTSPSSATIVTINYV
jgi:hypothetical protein